MVAVNVTLVIVPRERFSFAERSLQSIYENTSFPFELVYISAGAPERIRRYLESEAARRKFRLIHVNRYLSPNQARNLGLRAVRTKYVVFLDNDALVTPGWLDALVQCAEETGASVVGPLYLIGEPEQRTIHMAGGVLRLKEHEGQRILYDEQYLFDTPLAGVDVPLERRPWDYVEFHCMLARTTVFERLGPLDEKLLSHHEHIDLCLSVRRAGGLVYIEPKAVTSYVPPLPCEWSDLPYFMLRWSEAWNLATVRHFNEKWGISCVRFFTDKAGPDKEDTNVRWARGHRRLMTGLRVPARGAAGRPEQPLEQAELMVAMFQSVDRDCFDFALVNDGGQVMESEVALNPEQLLEQLPGALQKAEESDWNVMIRPVSRGDLNEPALLVLNDLDSDGLEAVQPYAFLTLKTRPQHYQCWLAVAVGQWRNAAALRRLVGASEGQGERNPPLHLAGSENVTGSWRDAEGRYPLVRLAEAVTGHLVTVHQLEVSRAAPYLWSGSIY